MITVKSLPIFDSDLISIDVTQISYGEKSKATNGAASFEAVEIHVDTSPSLVTAGSILLSLVLLARMFDTAEKKEIKSTSMVCSNRPVTVT